MSPRSAQQNEELRAAARTRIVDSALQLFASRGYTATPVDAIAGAAGVSAGLLYYHYADKHALLRDIFERSLADVGETFAAADREKNPADRLPALLRSIGVIIRNSFICSSRTDSGYPTMGASIARNARIWSMWFWMTSRAAPMPS